MLFGHTVAQSVYSQLWRVTNCVEKLEITSSSCCIYKYCISKHNTRMTQLCVITLNRQHFVVMKLRHFSKRTLNIFDRKCEISFRRMPPWLLESARWKQISYCLPQLSADEHSAGTLQIRRRYVCVGGSGGWCWGEGVANTYSQAHIFQSLHHL